MTREDEGGALTGDAEAVREMMEKKEADGDFREAEERMRSVVDHVLDGIITIDERGSIQTFNPAAEKIFGYRSADVVGRNVKMLMPEPYHGGHDGYLANYHRTGVPKIIGVGREVEGRRSDGSTFPMELAVSEFRHVGRRFYTGIVRDVTERKRLEKELHDRIAELAELDRRKDDFLAMLAHELRNPLAAVANAATLAAMPHAGDHVAWGLEVIDRQVKHLSRLIDDLLDVSRITRGKIELKTRRIDACVVMRNCLEAVRPSIEQKGHALVASLRPDLWVDADPTRLEQILANLLTNAAKYTDIGGTITVSARREGGEVVLSIRDTGVGIPADELPRMFEMFSQAKRSLARSEGGLGIGLTLARSLAEMHGGGVTAASDGHGQGAEFVVRLPAAPAGQAAASGNPPPAREPCRRILVVDDNPDIVEGLERLLKPRGHEVRRAYDGLTALQVAEELRPEIVLLDIGLPGMDGHGVAERLRTSEATHSSVIIAITGYGKDEDRRRSKEAGFDHHLVKPLDHLALLSLLAPSGAGAP